MEKDKKIWMVRAGSGSYLLDEFLTNNIIAIGWNDLGQLPTDLNQDQLRELFRQNHPDWSMNKTGQCVGQVWRFYNEFNIGDKVITYDSSGR